jgi:CHASE3 domain sensor protein
MMIRRLASVVFAMTLTATAAAQAPAWGGGAGGRGGQGGPRQWLDQMLTGFDRELGFDAQQWEQLDGVVTAQVERASAAFARWQEVGAAMAAGDEDRAAALRKQLQQEFHEREGGMQEMFDEIELVLHEDQLDRFHEMRQIMQQWRDHGRQMWQAVRDVPDAVGMTDAQRDEYQALLRDRWQAMQAEMRQRWEEEGEGAMWETPDFAALRDEFYGQVGELLDQDQRALLDAYRLQVATAGQPEQQQRVEDLRQILRAMKRVRGLSNEQYDALREIEREAQRAYGDVRRDQAQSAALARDVKARILAVLNAEQAAEFQQLLTGRRVRPARDAAPKP